MRLRTKLALLNLVVTILILLAFAVSNARADAPPADRNAAVIGSVFGPRYAEDAVSVSYCESRLTTTARNGQYRGLFQVSRHWRHTIPGFGPSARAQARHARRVFERVGRRWSPTWSCRP